MGHTLAMQIGHARQDLLEAALDFTWGHASLLDGRIEVTSRTELHHLAPVLSLVLYQIDGLDDIDVVQCR